MPAPGAACLTLLTFAGRLPALPVPVDRFGGRRPPKCAVASAFLTEQTLLPQNVLPLLHAQSLYPGGSGTDAERRHSGTGRLWLPLPLGTEAAPGQSSLELTPPLAAQMERP